MSYTNEHDAKMARNICWPIGIVIVVFIVAGATCQMHSNRMDGLVKIAGTARPEQLPSGDVDRWFKEMWVKEGTTAADKEVLLKYRELLVCEYWMRSQLLISQQRGDSTDVPPVILPKTKDDLLREVTKLQRQIQGEKPKAEKAGGI